jgi:ferredoxin-NADP reductase
MIERLPNIHSFVAYSTPAAQDRLGKDYDAQGHLTLETLRRLGVPHKADYYLCGPSAFLRTFTQDLTNEGVASSQLHQEEFGPEESRTPGIAKPDARAAHVRAGAAGPGPMVSFARSGLDVPWNPSATEAYWNSLSCDVRVKWSCRTGVRANAQ